MRQFLKPCATVFSRPLKPFLLAALGSLACVMAFASPPSNAPQVLIVVTNSESMDGSTSGAIMAGSGVLSSANTSLYNSSSPQNYTVPTGFTPPVNAGSGGVASYTYTCSGSSNYCDNSPSRLNLAKAAINTVTSKFANQLFFGLYDYSISSLTKYTTWVYYMSPSGGFTFTNTYTPPDSTTGQTQSVLNPCYGYTSASSTVKSNCSSLATRYGSGTISGNKYMNVSASSDDANINDILYSPPGLPSVFVSYGTINPATPYPPNFYLSDYNRGSIYLSYSNTVPSTGSFGTGPTNAGYVPYSKEVMYVLRGFGYGASQSATAGNKVVAIGDVTNSTTASAFAAALSPETNSTSTSEIKAAAGQSPTYGVLNGALSYLNTVSKSSCQQQYVILLTDGLPTEDRYGKFWPPLGSVSATNYGVTATFNSDGSLGTTNDQALTDAITAIKNLGAAGIKTYVIGLGAGVASSAAATTAAGQTLTAMAVAGGTNTFYAATDATSLNTALNAIAAAIYSQSTVASPVSSRNSTDLYVLQNDASFGQGSMLHYASGSATSPTWDAATLMSATSRAANLYSTASDNQTIKLLSDLQTDTAAFNISPTTCVPAITSTLNVVYQYMVNPSYVYSPSSGTTCSYLAGRPKGWFLGSFSSQNTFQVVQSPSSSLPVLLNDSSWLSYARSQSGRESMVLFTSSDGFLYAVDATSGNLLWGWTPRNLLAKFQNYASVINSQWMNGNFAVVDAKNSSGWSSYVVGSLQSGAEHFSLQLTAGGSPLVAAPTSVIFDNVVSGGKAPGDAAAALGSAPLHQIPQIVYTGGSAYYVYVVTNGSTSTLYETNVAVSGGSAITSATLAFVPSSALFVDQKTNQLYLGSSTDAIWRTTITGNAANDVATMQQIASTVSAADNSTKMPVTYVMDTMLNGVPYLIATNQSQITVFGVAASGGWAPLWASTPSVGYIYNGSKYVSSSAVNAMNASGLITDTPVLLGDIVLLPVTVPPTGCGNYLANYDFFAIPAGAFPTEPITYNNSPVAANLYFGVGIAYSPSLKVTQSGSTKSIVFTPGSSDTNTTSDTGGHCPDPKGCKTCTDPSKCSCLSGDKFHCGTTILPSQKALIGWHESN